MIKAINTIDFEKVEKKDRYKFYSMLSKRQIHKVVNQAIKDNNSEFKAYFARCDITPESELRKLFKNADKATLKSLLFNENTPKDIVEEISKQVSKSDTDLLIPLSLNKKTPREKLEELKDISISDTEHNLDNLEQSESLNLQWTYNYIGINAYKTLQKIDGKKD